MKELLQRLSQDIREIHRTHGAESATHVEEYLESALSRYSAAERDLILEGLAQLFRPGPPTEAASDSSPEAFSRLITMLLGKDILQRGLTQDEMIEQLASALNTVFDSVNNLVSAMNTTLMGGQAGDETIRVVISASMDKDKGLQALERFLDQIGDFFAIALEAFKRAAETRVDDLLNELDPESLASDDDMGMKFGPMRKAYLYDCFVEKYNTLRQWQRSGVLARAFLKEFENNCQNLYMKK